ncbi:MAG: T9SS type A sorting domain-containing protein [Flavobacteriales bacterium]
MSAPNVSWHFDGPAYLEEYGDGTAHLWGTIMNAGNNTLKMTVDFWFHNGMNWAAWSALGRGYKDDLQLAATTHVDWNYYELMDGYAVAHGIGALEGTQLTFQHKPSNYYYGFQSGMAANNKNANEGFSGWFFFEGNYDGEPVNGHGDINVDKSCEDGPDGCASTAYTQVCRAEDVCGNISFQSQTIYVVDDEAPVADDYETPISLLCTDYLGIFITAADNCSEIIITYVDEVIVPGCNGQIIRHYTIADGCGNTSTADQTINLYTEDDLAFVNFPQDMEVGCDEIETIPLPDVTWEGGCANVELSVIDNTIAGDCDGSYTITHTYTLTDDCGNEVTQTWTITVVDTTPPVFINVPDNIVIGCGDPVPPADVLAIDACSDNVNVSIEASTEYLNCGYIFTRTWTAVDDCGNVAMVSQTVTVEDDMNPFFTYWPPNITVNCDEPFELDSALYDDACSATTLSLLDIPLGDCAGSFVRVWRVFDGCGNQAVQSTMVTKVDNTPPVMTNFPEDVTVNCGEIPTVESADIEYTDNCGSVSVDFDETTEPSECGNNILRIWTLTDECGNSSEWIWTISLSDNEPPVLIGVPEDTQTSCGQDLEDSVVEAIDNCDSDVQVTLEATTEPLECGYLFIRTWSATDNCGNTATATQNIIVSDEDFPEWTFIPDNVNLACGEGVSIDDLPLAEAYDECTDVTVTYEDEILGGNCGDGLLRTFTAMDGCGNTITATQLISFDDDEAPVFTNIPDDVTAPCGTEVELETPEATDNCSTPEITFSDMPNDACAGSYTRTYTATDGCGNTAQVSVNVYFTDEDDPTFTNTPDDVTVECDNVPTIESADIQYMDNCGAVEVEFTELNTPSDDCENAYTIERTWTITDDCGNASSFVWTITVEDNSAPMLFGVPEDDSINCGEEVSEAVVVGTDNCGGEVIVILSAETLPAECGQIFVRTWTAIDACGNTTIASSSTTIADITPPVFTYIPDDVLGDCTTEEGEEDPDFGMAEAEDECGSEVTITFEDTENTTECGTSFVRTFTATDDCGNSATATQTINLSDGISPEFTFVPDDISVPCGDEFELEMAEATDACSTVEIAFADEAFVNDCAGGIIRTFTATDGCGNTTDVNVTITYTDNEGPVFTSFPGDVEASCDDIPTIESANITYDDLCGSTIAITSNENIVEGHCPGNYTLLRTWTLTDGCGNETTQTWTITVTDNEAPAIIGVPSDITINCGDDITEAVVFADDNCDPNASVSLTASTEPNECGYIFIRTWTANDACGNENMASQIITVEDNIPPVFTFVPGTAVIDCDDNLEETLTEVAEASDECSSVTVTYQDISDVLGTECAISFIRQWLATDGCGNVTTANQQVIVTDISAPEFIDFPQDVTVMSCGDIPSIDDANVTYQDNCSNVTVVVNEEEENLGCANSYVLHRTWTLTDGCGNQTSMTWNIYVVDEESPQVLDIPDNYTVSCGDDIAEVNITAIDNCSAADDIEISLHAKTTFMPCGYIFVRVWTVTDECGNTTEVVQEITVTDEEAPVIQPMEEFQIFNCFEELILEDPIITDACSEVTYTDELVLYNDYESCDGQLYWRIITATDGCGNITIDTTEVIVNDYEFPLPSHFPDDITTSCDNLPVITVDMVTFTDNCDPNPTVELDVISNQGEGECDGEYNIVYTWFATDHNCNTETVTQVVYVFDNTPPVFSSEPKDTTFSCTEVVPLPEIVTAMDACSGAADVIFIETVIPGVCDNTYEIHRTWTTTDDCGNTATHTQIISIVDNTAPEFLPFETELDLPCTQINGVFVVAMDECSSVNLSYEDELIGTSCDGVVMRTYTAEDACGNVSIAVQTIQLFDEDAPDFITFPEDVTVDCGNIPTANSANVEYQDNCSFVEVEIVEESVVGNCVNNYVLTRTWFLTDACGNINELTWTITVVDNAAPTLFGVPDDVTIDCSEFDNLASADVFAFDNCTAFPSVSLNAQTEDTECGFIFTRTWTAEDECGNINTDSQIVTVTDLFNPELSEYPADITMPCGDPIPDAPAITATDNCDDDVEVFFSEQEVGTPNCLVVVRTWCATDCSGNEECHVQTITQEDAPTLAPNANLHVSMMANGNATIKATAGSAGMWTVDMFDLNGRMVQAIYAGEMQTDQMRTFTVDAESVSDGIYFIRFTDGDETITRKLVLVHY